jgi:hypothetical protein
VTLPRQSGSAWHSFLAVWSGAAEQDDAYSDEPDNDGAGAEDERKQPNRSVIACAREYGERGAQVENRGGAAHPADPSRQDPHARDRVRKGPKRDRGWKVEECERKSGGLPATKKRTRAAT